MQALRSLFRTRGGSVAKIPQGGGSASFKAASPGQQQWEEQPAKQRNYTRDELDEELGAASWASNVLAVGVFRMMNLAMKREAQPITPEHYMVLKDSLVDRRQSICQTLQAENEAVMKSEGSTPIYWLGKNFVHKPIHYLKKE